MATLIEKTPSEKWRGFALRDLNQANRALFQAVQSVVGVQDLYLCDNHGQVLGALVATPFDAERSNQLGLQFAHLFAVGHAHGKKTRDLELRLARGNVLARDLGNAFIVVVCAPQVDWSLLRMALNVAAAPYEKNGELQDNLRAAAPARTEVLAVAATEPTPAAEPADAPSLAEAAPPQPPPPKSDDDDRRYLWAKFP